MEEGPEPEDWHQLYWDAWEAIRYDRVYGAFGGELPVSFQAISRYCADHHITGQNFATFRTLFAVLDDEWLIEVAKRLKRKPPP